ncbi:MAG: ethanolamine ammonia-lyase subunit EutC, partial [Comamonadaceae bacterium]
MNDNPDPGHAASGANHAVVTPADASGDAGTDLLRTLRQHTTARIGLGRTGGSLPMAEVLRFGLAHARARDAVHLAMDTGALAGALETEGFRVMSAHSRATDRQTYLLRPDLGRQLDEASLHALSEAPPAADIAIVIADGLSSIAVQRHALPVMTRLRQALGGDGSQRPVVVVGQGRVAVGDDVGAALKA